VGHEHSLLRVYEPYPGDHQRLETDIPTIIRRIEPPILESGQSVLRVRHPAPPSSLSVFGRLGESIEIGVRPPHRAPERAQMSSHAVSLRFSLCRLGIRCRCPGYLTFRTAFCERHSSGISICRVSASAIRLVGCRPSTMNPTTVSRQHKFGQNGVIEEDRIFGSS
jgi:hypothetical protein